MALVLAHRLRVGAKQIGKQVVANAEVATGARADAVRLVGGATGCDGGKEKKAGEMETREMRECEKRSREIDESARERMDT